MLILTRRLGETLKIGDDVEVIVMGIHQSAGVRSLTFHAAWQSAAILAGVDVDE